MLLVVFGLAVVDIPVRVDYFGFGTGLALEECSLYYLSIGVYELSISIKILIVKRANVNTAVMEIEGSVHLTTETKLALKN